MKQTLQKIMALTFALLMLLSLGACAPKPAAEGDGTETDTAEKTIIVGLDDTFAPMGFRDENGTLVGFDIDLANAVAEAIGYQVVFQPIDWDSKELELSSGKIDCIWNGMSATPERKETMLLSRAYLNNKIIIMTNEGVEIATKEDLANYNIGTQAKSAALEVLEADDIYETIKDKVTTYRNYDEVIMDMQAGRIDVMIVDEVLGFYKNTQLDNVFGVAPVDFGEDLFVIGFRKDDTELKNLVEQGLDKVIESGKAAEISQKWFGKDIVIQ